MWVALPIGACQVTRHTSSATRRACRCPTANAMSLLKCSHASWLRRETRSNCAVTSMSAFGLRSHSVECRQWGSGLAAQYCSSPSAKQSSDLCRDHAATECASRFTFRRWRIAWKMAARLSMLGLPADDNMRCRLLLGLAVKVDSCSKPIVALIRSRRIRRAVSGSPLRNKVAASSSSACVRARPARPRSA